MTGAPGTLSELFARCISRGQDSTALHLPNADGSFRTLTWNDFAHEIRRLAVGLQRAGLEPGGRVAQVSENRYEWILVDLAVHLARGVHVAVHAALSGRQIAHQLVDSGAQILLLSTPQQAEKLAAGDLTLPRGLQSYSYEPVEQSVARQEVLPFSELFAGARRDAVSGIESEALRQTRPGDLATILYTSGTTGDAKGVMLSHGNLTSNAVASCAAFGFDAEDVGLSWLPLSHIFARTCDLYTWLYSGNQLALVEEREKIIAACPIVRPTRMTGVPYFYEKVLRHLSSGNAAGANLKEFLGGRMRLCISGGAALPDHVAEYFWSQGVPLVQGYGLTESSPVITTSTPEHNKIGSVGRAIDGVEVKIAADGEIVTRGPHVMLGYWNRPADTAQAIRDGWLHTGDLGAIDAEGYLKITGRKKELIVTAGGKNIAPAYLEGLLAEEPLIAQAIVIGDARKYLAALIVPSAEALRAEIIARKIPVTSAAEALIHPAVQAIYRQQIDARLAGVSQCEQIQRFRLLPRAFCIEQEEITPTLKLRREVICDHFAREIQELYAD